MQYLPTSVVKLVGRFFGARPDAIVGPDGQDGQEVRLGRYGEVAAELLWPNKQRLADEGSYFTLTSPTIDTGVNYGTAAPGATAFVDTTPALVLWNGYAASDPKAKNTYVDFIRIIMRGTIPAASTGLRWVAKTDQATNRVPTSAASTFQQLGAGSATPWVCTNHGSGNASPSKLWIPPVAAAAGMSVPASTTSRLIDFGSLRSVIPVVLDEYMLRFASVDGIGRGTGAGAGMFANDAAPFVIPPGGYGLIYLYTPSGTTSPITFELSVGIAER